MEVRHTSKVETTISWTATLQLQREEFDNLLTVLAGAAEAGIEGAQRVLDDIRDAGENPDIGWPVRPITTLKRKASGNGVG